MEKNTPVQLHGQVWNKSFQSRHVTHSTLLSGQNWLFLFEDPLPQGNLSSAMPGERRFGHVRQTLYLYKRKAFSFPLGRQERFLQRRQLTNGTQARETANPEQGGPSQEGLDRGTRRTPRLDRPALQRWKRLTRAPKETQRGAGKTGVQGKPSPLNP